MDSPVPVSISTPGMDLDIEMIASSSSTHSFHSSLLDDFQLDLELECEDDSITFITKSKDYVSSWNSAIDSAHCNVPLANTLKKFPYDYQTMNPTITNLIESNCIAASSKENDLDLVTRKEVLSVKTSTVKVNQSQNDHSSSLSRIPSLSTSNRHEPFPLPPSATDAVQVGIVCPLCSILFSSVNSLQLHFADQHNKIKVEPDNHQCTSCGKYFASKMKLTRHMKRHTAIKTQKGKIKEQGPFHCDICLYVTNKKSSLEKHNKSQHNSKREVFSCNLCSFSCVQERSFKVHKFTHEGVDGKFACDQCGKLFYTMSILKRHARTHSTFRPYVCQFDNCKKAFTIESRLTDHIRCVHKKASTALKKNEFAIHDDNFQQNESVPQVKDPSAKSIKSQMKDSAIDNPLDHNTSSSVPVHKEDNVRTGSENDDSVIFVYDIILPASEIKSGEDKTEIHTSSKFGEWTQHLNNAGEYCLDSKSSQATCASHPKKTIGQRKRFACPWSGCGKSFRDSYNLSKHMCTHTGEMEKACPFCRYRCIQKSALDKHMTTH